jgi:hypothetical protein
VSDRMLLSMMTAIVLLTSTAAHAQQKAPAKARATGTAPAPATPVATVATRPSEPTAQAPAAAPAATPVAAHDADAPGDARLIGEHARFGVTGGMSAPMSSLGKAFSAGFNAGAFVTGRPAGFPVSLRGDLQYVRFTGKNEAVTPSYAVIQFSGAAVYDFPTAGGAKSPFFATGGMGLYRQSAAGESQTDFGTNLGLGFNFRSLRGKPFVEGRFHFFNDVEHFSLAAGFRI